MIQTPGTPPTDDDIIGQQLAAVVDTLRAGGEHGKADAVQASAAYLQDAIRAPSVMLYDRLTDLRDNAAIIMMIIEEMAYQAPDDTTHH